jgi:osmotically inducible protein OsmC
MTQLLHTAKTHITGDREYGASRNPDGRLDIEFSPPGSPRGGTDPELPLAAGWSASFGSAIGLAARKMKISPPNQMAIDAEVDLDLSEGGYFLRTRLNVNLPGIDREVAQALIDESHQTCPYCKATRGNINLVITLISTGSKVDRASLGSALAHAAT